MQQFVLNKRLQLPHRYRRHHSFLFGTGKHCAIADAMVQQLLRNVTTKRSNQYTWTKLFQIPECNAVLKLHFRAETSWQKSISVKDLLLIFAELGRTDTFHAASVLMFPCCQH